MILKTADAGIQAALDYSNTAGPQPNIILFKVGSAPTITLPDPVLPSNQSNGTAATDVYNDPSAPADTDFFKVLTYRKVGVNLYEYVLELKNDIGDFNITNVGLYTTDPQYDYASSKAEAEASAKLFAIGVFDVPYWKEKIGSGTTGNTIEFTVRISFGGAEVEILWETNETTSALLLEKSSVDMLPTTTTAESNIYLINGDYTTPMGRTDGGETFFATVRDNTYWSLSEYSTSITDKQDGSHIAISNSTPYSLESVDLPHLEYADGRYVVQFTSGAHEGILRAVTSIDNATKTINWDTSLAAPPESASTFQILISDFFDRTRGNVKELESVDDLPKPSETDVQLYNIVGNALGVGRDEAQNSTLAFHNDKHRQQWRLSNYTVRHLLGNASSDPYNSVTSLHSTDLGSNLLTAFGFSEGQFVIRFQTGNNAGLMRKIILQEPDKIQWTKPLPNVPQLGDAFHIFRSDNLSFRLGGSGGGGGGGGAGAGSYIVESFVAGAGGQTIFDMTDIRAELAIVYVGGVYQNPTTYTYDALAFPNRIVFNEKVPEGHNVHFLQVAMGVALNGFPVGGVQGDILVKNSNIDFDVSWNPLVIDVPMDSVKLRFNGGVNSIKLSRNRCGLIPVGDKIRRIPENGLTLDVTGAVSGRLHNVFVAPFVGDALILMYQEVVEGFGSFLTKGALGQLIDVSLAPDITYVGSFIKTFHNFPTAQTHLGINSDWSTRGDSWLCTHYLRSYYSDIGTLTHKNALRFFQSNSYGDMLFPLKPFPMHNEGIQLNQSLLANSTTPGVNPQGTWLFQILFPNEILDYEANVTVAGRNRSIRISAFISSLDLASRLNMVESIPYGLIDGTFMQGSSGAPSTLQVEIQAYNKGFMWNPYIAYFNIGVESGNYNVGTTIFTPAATIIPSDLYLKGSTELKVTGLSIKHRPNTAFSWSQT